MLKNNNIILVQWLRRTDNILSHNFSLKKQLKALQQEITAGLGGFLML